MTADECMGRSQQWLESWLWKKYPNQPVRIALMLRILNGTRH